MVKLIKVISVWNKFWLTLFELNKLVLNIFPYIPFFQITQTGIILFGLLGNPIVDDKQCTKKK